MEDKNRKLTSKDECVQIAIYIGSLVCLSNYQSRPVLYAAILPYCTNDDRIILQIGYTSNIIDHIISLKSEFNSSKISLIGIRLVRNKNDHKTFNKILAKKFKYQREKVNGINKTGTYWLSELLMDEFDAIDFVDDDHLPINCYDDVMELFAQMRLQGLDISDRECLVKETENLVRGHRKMIKWIDTQKANKLLF